MKKLISLFISIMCCFLLTANAATVPAPKKSAGFSPDQVKQIEQIVHNYLLENPQVLIEVGQKLQQQQASREDAQVAEIKANVKKYRQDLFNDKAIGRSVGGNPNGKITMVEVLQYQCGHCKLSAPLVDKLIKNNPDLKVIYIQWPFFGDDAVYAAKLALAAQKQGKFKEVHAALLAGDFANKDAADKIVATIKGLDITKLNADMKDKSFDAGMQGNFKLCANLKLIGTPTFMFANQDLTKVSLVPGATRNMEADLNKAINEVR